DRIAEDIPDSERAELLEALRDRLTGWPVYRGSAGSALAYGSGVVVDISPAAPLGDLARAVREVLRAVRGEAAGTYRQPKAHLSLAYAHSTADSDPWQSKLRKVDPNHAVIELAEVHLVDVRVEVRPDSETPTFTWESLGAQIRLTG
ncbi:MAG: hypothetical protein ACRDQ0_02350, partial [Pseudonocardia sp.]